MSIFTGINQQLQQFDSSGAPGATPGPGQRTRGQNRIAQGFSPFWYESPDLWDTVTLQGVALPGICKVTARKGRKLEVNSAPGSDGARLRDRGYEPARVTVTVRIWTPDQFAAWEQTNLGLIANGGRQRQALDISHPKLNNYGIRRVYLESIGTLDESGVRGIYEAIINFVEFTLPTPRPQAPVQAGQVAAANTGFDNNPTSAANTPSTNGAAAPSPNFVAPPR